LFLHCPLRLRGLGLLRGLLLRRGRRQLRAVNVATRRWCRGRRRAGRTLRMIGRVRRLRVVIGGVSLLFLVLAIGVRRVLSRTVAGPC
jgi:hypothetical protein